VVVVVVPVLLVVMLQVAQAGTVVMVQRHQSQDHR
jgi:hypothetical protein